MNLASLEDVNRVLRFTTGDDTARDAQVRSSLAVVEAWADGRLKIAREGPGVTTYYDVYEDATLPLPSPDCVVTKVKILGWSDQGWFPGGWSDVELGQGYDLTDTGEVILRPSFLVQPFSGAMGRRVLRTYDHVEVHWIGTGVVPRDVTEGIAILAAGYHMLGPQVLQAVIEEKIGDYSYKTNRGEAGQDAAYVSQAMFFLGNRMKRRRVSVT